MQSYGKNCVIFQFMKRSVPIDLGASACGVFSLIFLLILAVKDKNVIVDIMAEYLTSSFRLNQFQNVNILRPKCS